MEELIESLRNLLISDEIQNKGNEISDFELKLSKNLNEVSKISSFFNLPFQTIKNIIKLTDFSLLEDSIDIISAIIKNISLKFPEESCSILNYLNCKNCDFTLSECINLIKLFPTSELCCEIANLYDESNKEIDVDYEYELKNKINLIESMKLKINELEKKNEEINEEEEEEDSYQDEDKEISDDRQKFNDIMKELHRQYFNILYVINTIENNPKLAKMRDKDGRTLLHTAAQYGHINVVMVLIDRFHAKINARDYKKVTPLFLASSCAKTSCVIYLILKGANPKITTDEGICSLNAICKGGDQSQHTVIKWVLLYLSNKPFSKCQVF